MKSTPHLRSPVTGTGMGLPPSPSKPIAPSLRKIASNRRINTTSSSSSSTLMAGGHSTGSNSSTSSVASGSGGLKNKSSTIGTAGGFTLELTTSASPTRSRTISHQSSFSSRSSPSKSKSPTPSALASGSGSGGFAFSSLSFVNYGMDDADEICSAVAPSGSYKVPLRGFGTSSGEEDDFDDEGSVRTRTASNVTGTMMGSSDDDESDMRSPTSTIGGTPGSPTKKVRKNSSRPNLLVSGEARSNRNARWRTWEGRGVLIC